MELGEALISPLKRCLIQKELHWTVVCGSGHFASFWGIFATSPEPFSKIVFLKLHNGTRFTLTVFGVVASLLAVLSPEEGDVGSDPRDPSRACSPGRESLGCWCLIRSGLFLPLLVPLVRGLPFRMLCRLPPLPGTFLYSAVVCGHQAELGQAWGCWEREGAAGGAAGAPGPHCPSLTLTPSTQAPQPRCPSRKGGHLPAASQVRCRHAGVWGCALAAEAPGKGKRQSSCPAGAVCNQHCQRWA